MLCTELYLKVRLCSLLWYTVESECTVGLYSVLCYTIQSDCTVRLCTVLRYNISQIVLSEYVVYCAKLEKSDIACTMLYYPNHKILRAATSLYSLHRGNI